MKSLVVILGLLVAATQAAPGGGPTPLIRYMSLIEGAPKVPAPKIVNGSPATEGQFPYQGALLIDGGTFCGCSLISAQWALTAAHCAQGSSFQVYLGRLLWQGSGGVVVMTSSKTVHSGYNPSTLANDVALLRFPNPVGLTNLIQPVVLAEGSNQFNGVSATVSGYGLTSQPGSVSPNLNYVNLPIITNNECAQYYGSIIGAWTICASGAGGRSTCSGDSGGPLVAQDGGLKQIGVVSFVSSAGCASGYPSGYGRVSYHRDWIRTNSGV